MNSRRSI